MGPDNRQSSWFWLQALVAIGLGVCIGLMLSKVVYKRCEQAGLTKPAAMTQAATAINNAISQVKVVPTLEQRMNVLLMGVDWNGVGTQRFTSCRSDTMILVSCDPVSKRVGMLSIPRDSRVKIEGHGIDKINAAHAFGGPELAVETVKEAFGVPIDHYIVIDAQGLKKVFQVLGPIDVLVEKRMRYTDHAGRLHVALDPGLHQLTPEQAEEYVRFRHDARGDIGRIERQQWFLRQVSRKLREPAVILKLPELFKLANQYVVTDLSIEDMARLATFGKDIQPSQVETATLPGSAVMIRGGSYWAPDPAADAIVFNRLLGTPMSLPLQEETGKIAPNSAIAAEDESGDEPVTVALKYPKGADQASIAFEKALSAEGYKVKYRIRTDVADCQHEQIVQNSKRADDSCTRQLQHRMPILADWPVAINLETRPIADVTIFITPGTKAPAPPQEKDAESTAK